jgi:hypothetical protein
MPAYARDQDQDQDSQSCAWKPGYGRRRQKGWLIARAIGHGACSALVDLTTMNRQSAQQDGSGTSGAERDPILGPA